MRAQLLRSFHGPRPSSSGIEVDDDGVASAWQTSGEGVGRFGRPLAPDEMAILGRAVAEADPASAPSNPPARRRPSATIERLAVDGHDPLEFDPHDPPAGMAALVEFLRDLHDAVTDSPVAAVALDLGSASLRHVGHDPIDVRIDTLGVEVTVFDRNSAIVDQRSTSVDVSGHDRPAGPGWRVDLGVDLAATPPGGGFQTITVGRFEADVLGDGVFRGCELGAMIQ